MPELHQLRTTITVVIEHDTGLDYVKGVGAVIRDITPGEETLLSFRDHDDRVRGMILKKETELR